MLVAAMQAMRTLTNNSIGMCPPEGAASVAVACTACVVGSFAGAQCSTGDPSEAFEFHYTRPSKQLCKSAIPNVLLSSHVACCSSIFVQADLLDTLTLSLTESIHL